MKTVHVFDIADYHHALGPTNMHDGIYYRQKGGGVGGVFGAMKRYSIPIVQKYLVPHFREAVVNTVKDVALHGSTVGGALKNNTKKFFGGIGEDIYKNIVQKGRGISRKRVSKSHKCISPKKKSRAVKAKPKKGNKKKPVKRKPAKKKSQQKSKLDIFS